MTKEQKIKDNNGWIRIESEEDFPKKSGDYWVANNNQISFGIYYNEPKIWEDESEQYRIFPTHYQPIIKPEPPIY